MKHARIGSQAAALVAVLIASVIATQYLAPSALAAPMRTVREVRTFELDDLRISNPAGVAFSPAANALHIVEATGQGTRRATDIARVALGEQRLRSARISAQLGDPVNIAFDGRRRRLLAYAAAGDRLIEVDEDRGALDPSTLGRHDGRQLGIDDPQGMTTDPANGDIYILDRVGPRIIRVTPSQTGGLDDPAVSDIDLGSTGLTDPVGLAFDPTTGHLHVLDTADDVLYELRQTGAIVATRDLSEFELIDPQGMVFAPSGDLTDDPRQMSLYLADSGIENSPPVVSDVTPTSAYQTTSTTTAAAETSTTAQASTVENDGQLLELSFVDTPSLAETVADSTVSSLVQTINSYQWSPPSPDTSGVVHLPASDHLLAVDGEVNEMPIYAGANTFESTLSGSLVDTFTTLDFGNNEPTGVSVNPANNHLYISQDTPPKLVYEVDPGADGDYATADDTVTSFTTTDFGSTDPEGVTYAPSLNALFIADGLNSEIYHISPGPNGTFDGVAPSGDDQVVDQFDTFGLGMDDPEGIAYDPRSNSLYIGGKTRNIGQRNFDTLLEVSATGTLIRTIDVSAANPNRQIVKQKLSGLAYGPSSIDPDAKVLYIADRGEDNNNDPNENDGRIYEMTLPASSNDPVAPLAVDDNVVTVVDTVVSVNAAANDSDPNGNLDPASTNSACANGSTGCAGAASGSLTDNGDGTITYTPNAGFVGSDSFVYEICDTTSPTPLCDTATVNVTVNEPAGTGDATEFVSFDANTTVPGITGGVRDEDIVSYDQATGTWAMYFDASDLGIASSDLDAFHVRDDGSVLLSFSSGITIPGLTGGPSGDQIGDADLVLFTPTSTGATTAGNFSFYFDGSDVGLDTSAEDVTGVHEFADGSLGITTTGNLNVAGLEQGRDEDVHRFTGTFGATTSGSWALIFDGSDVGMTTSGDDLDGTSFPNDNDLLFSTKGSYAAAGGAGDDEDISRFVGTFGPTTSGTAALEYDLSTLGIDPAADVDGVHITDGAPPPSNDPVAPLAVDDNVVTVVDTVVSVNAAANDSDLNGNLDPASTNSACANGSTGCAGAASGSLTDNGDGTITYTPNAGFVGSDSFVYEICDTTSPTPLCDTATVNVTVNEPAGTGDATEFVSFDVNTTVPGITGGVRDEDIVSYDQATGTWAMYFDASDLGIASSDLDAFHVRDDGSVLLSFSSGITIPGLTGGPSGDQIGDADLVLFTPTSTGATTAGNFSFYFDGSDVGLDTSAEDVTGVHEFADGSLGITTTGNLNVAGLEQGRDEDVHRFTGTFGATTSGSWALIFDGSDVGMTTSGDDLDGTSFPNDNDLLFSTKGSYAAAGGAGDDEDISRFVGTFGPTTSGTAALEYDLSTLGIDPAADVDGVHITDGG